MGLVGTLQTTFNEPVELAKQLATLDHLTDGRAGWNVVTSSDAFHGANFRRGGFLDHADRYTRAAEFVELSRALWDSWESDAIVANGSGAAGGAGRRRLRRPLPRPRRRPPRPAVRRDRHVPGPAQPPATPGDRAGRRLRRGAATSPPGTPRSSSRCTPSSTTRRRSTAT
ncbi:LLM class flavin-dependent oxidoreductase [Curtobacterium flaccumfaciens]|nr:LLM class flavin-dependent oxidoreductase [Curtobacterium flaccumfaciens]